jgi:phage protein D
MDGVAYKLEIGGAPASPELLSVVETIEVEDHAELADMLRLRLAIAVRGDGSDWTVLDSNPFTRLAQVRVGVTVGTNPERRLIDARVIESRVEFSNEPGGSRLEVIGMDPTVLLNLEEKVRPWPDMTDSDIAAAIFGEHGFAAEVEATQIARQEVDRTIVQRGTDMQFVRQLAERNGYECFVELDDTGTPKCHFHPPRLDQPSQGVLSVNFGQATNVNEFVARHDMLRPATVAAAGLDVETGDDQTGESEQSQLRGLGSSPATAGDNPRRILLTGTGLSQSGELQALAQALVDRSSWALIAEGELNTVAYGDVIRAKRPVQVRGVGGEFSGTYYVDRVHHIIGGEGYVQRFTLRRNASGVASGESFAQQRRAA